MNIVFRIKGKHKVFGLSALSIHLPVSCIPCPQKYSAFTSFQNFTETLSIKRRSKLWLNYFPGVTFL